MNHIARMYAKVNSAEELAALKNNPKNAKWWHDSRCARTVVADFSAMIGEIEVDTDPSLEEQYPQLICAEIVTPLKCTVTVRSTK